MFGWWSEDYLVKNSHTPIYIYTNEIGSKVMVIAITDSFELLPDNIHKWISVGQINKYLHTINFNNCVNCFNNSVNSLNDKDDVTPQKKRQKISLNDN